MWRMIVKQIWNRRRSNTWIALELLCVFCLTWYLVDYLFVLGYNYSLPNHRDSNHTWQVSIGELPATHPDYKAEEQEGAALEANFGRLLQSIRNCNGVEAVAVSRHEATPGYGGYWGVDLRRPDDSTRVVSGQRMMITPEGDFFRVFGYTTDDGERPVSIADFDSGVSNGIVIDQATEELLFPDGNAVGKELEEAGEGTRYTVTGVVGNTKRFDYLRPQHAYILFERLDSTLIQSAAISVRSSASIPDDAFRSTFASEMEDAARVGNFYLKKVVPFSKVESNIDRRFGLSNEVKMKTGLLVFLLINILLCVMGTFWYRITQRQNEIGLRKAIGATVNNVRIGLMAEGVLLLSLVTIPAILIESQFVMADLIDTLGRFENAAYETTFLPDRTFVRFLITNAITWCLLAATVAAAIWLPATRAARMQAAEALHYE